MSQKQAAYLFSLPLVLHVPHMHFYVVHAGILPSDPRLPPTDPAQPLAHPPILADDRFNLDHTASDVIGITRPQARLPAAAAQDVEALRRMQESAVLSDVPQNRDPWVVLNMRSVTKKKHRVTRDGDSGTPWSELWNAQMGRCRGYDAGSTAGARGARGRRARGEGDEEEVQVQKKGKQKEYVLPCHPATVVYGHAATRGLDIKRWSMGLDTGCLYGRQLTALVLTNGTLVQERDEEFGEVEWSWEEDNDDEDDEEDEEDEDEEDEDEEDEEESRRRRKRLQFGDDSSGISAMLYKVKCPNMND
jgi:hypothetical protein